MANNKTHLLDSIALHIITDDPELIDNIAAIIEKTFAIDVGGSHKSLTRFESEVDQVEPDTVLIVDTETVSADEISTFLDSNFIPILTTAPHNPAGLQSCFSCMSGGSLDLIFKEDLTEKADDEDFRRLFFSKIIGAVKLDSTQAPPSKDFTIEHSLEKSDDIIFCEDCGARNIFPSDSANEKICGQCGDVLETHLINRYQRTHYVTVIAAGEGSYYNLLKIIPKIASDISGAIIILVADQIGHVDTFTRYLGSISKLNVHRIKNGTQVEGGSCYVAAADENFFMKPYSTSNRMERAKTVPGYGPADALLKSVSESFKNNSAGLFLSGVHTDGERGLSFLKDNGGISAVLFSANCMFKQLGDNILRKCAVDKIVGVNDATLFITELHSAKPNIPSEI